MTAANPPEASDEPRQGPDRELEAIKLSQAKAEVRKAIAEAERATFTAALPQSKSVAPEGKTDIGQGAGYLSELAAYCALSRVAAEVAKALAHSWIPRPS
jgi:hypothetical protein